MLINAVAPFAGAWIEILEIVDRIAKFLVAPFAGAWIEIALTSFSQGSDCVAPFAGAWIEIMWGGVIKEATSRSLRGSVD